jgi:hypothetical protein
VSDKPVVSRRSILRGATVIAPTILTLHSGAALAKSSNLITSNSLTLPDAGTVAATGAPNQYDLGAPVSADVTRINAMGEYHRLGDHSPRGIVSPQQMCTEGGTFERKSWSGWSNVTVDKGGLVSATALSSFASGIRYTDV